MALLSDHIRGYIDVDIIGAYFRLSSFSVKFHLKPQKMVVTVIRMEIYKNATARLAGTPLGDKVIQFENWCPSGVTYADQVASIYDKWCSIKEIPNIPI